MAQFIDAYNKHTGEKVHVPESYVKLFPDALAKTPTQKASEKKATTTTSKES